MKTSGHLKYLGMIWGFFVLLGGSFALAGVKVTLLSRDAAQVTNQPFYVGMVSNMGLLMWCAGGTVAFFCSAALRKKEGPCVAERFFRYLAILMALLMLDDLLMLHEILFPTYLHLPEICVYVTYFIYTAVFLLVYRRFILEKTDYKILLLAFVFFGLSIAMDADIIRGGIDIEDGFKVFGIATMAYYAIFTAAGFLGRAGEEVLPERSDRQAETR